MIPETDPVSIPEIESQPTPPPRKKKLKKKLEQIVEKQLDQSLVEKRNVDVLQEGEKLTVSLEATNLDGDVSVEETCPEPQVEPEEMAQGTSPKKSRRKKKHNTVQE